MIAFYMKFRFYQLLSVASAVLLVLAMFGRVMSFTEADGSKMLVDNFKLLSPGGEVSRSVMALGVLLIFAAAVNLFTLLVSLFSNFELQKRSVILSMLVLAGYYVLLLICSLLLVSGASIVVDLPILYPFFALILNAVSFNLIRRQEAKIIARAAGFRLRD